MKLTQTLLAALLLAPLATLRVAAEPVTNSIGMKLVRIEGGTFTMGQDGPPIAGNGNMATDHAEFRSADWDEKPAHRVTITQPFHMAVTEVTLAQFRKFDLDFRKGKGAEDDAVQAITWTKAVAFCEWLSKQEGQTYRLPTEAEWEYACRAGTTTLFHTGDTLPGGHQKWFGRQGWRELYFPDGQMPPEYAWQDGAASLRVAQNAANAWGLHDMHGNLAEWCLDGYGPYQSAGQTDPLGRFDDVADQERFGFKMPVSYTSDLGETWHYEASEFPVVSSTQRPVLLRLKEGPIVLCSFTDQARDLKNGRGGKGLTFKSTSGDFTGVGLFAAVSYDEGQTWPDRRLIVGPGQPFPRRRADGGGAVVSRPPRC